MLTPVHIRHRSRLQEAVDVGVLLGRGFQQLEAKLSARVLLGDKMLGKTLQTLGILAKG